MNDKVMFVTEGPRRCTYPVTFLQWLLLCAEENMVNRSTWAQQRRLDVLAFSTQRLFRKKEESG